MAAHIGSATTAVRRNLANGLNSVLSWTPLNARIGGEDGVGGEGAPRLCCRQGGVRARQPAHAPRMQECLRQHRAGWLTTLRPCTGNAVGNIVNEMNKRMLQLTDTCTSQMLATQARLEAVVVPDACAPLPPPVSPVWR